ncbi:MAG: CPBP family intramembrane metalloprotease [Bacteroidales bacterium]|nr:CPBP family intramembrane metalloprotease [Bacteroidales bacterium]
MLKAFLAFLAFIAYQCTAAALAYLIDGEALAQGTLPDATALVTAQMACVPLIILLLWLCRMTQRPLPGKGRPLPGTTMTAALAGFMCVAVGLSVGLSPLDLADGGSTALLNGMSRSIGGVLLLTVFGPLVEEMVFRESIQRLLTPRTGALWATVIAAASFAAVHMNPAQSIPAFLLGLALGWLYILTGNIKLCYSAHVINNALAVWLLSRPDIEARVATWPAAAIVAVGAALIALGVLLLLTTRRHAPSLTLTQFSPHSTPSER